MQKIQFLCSFARSNFNSETENDNIIRFKIKIRDV